VGAYILAESAGEIVRLYPELEVWGDRPPPWLGPEVLAKISAEITIRLSDSEHPFLAALRMPGRVLGRLPSQKREACEWCASTTRFRCCGWSSMAMLRRYLGRIPVARLKRYPTTLPASWSGRCSW
jgi:hypothetical protein